MEICTIFRQKAFNPTVVGALQGFKFFRQNTWFLETNGALSKFLFGILHYLIRIIELQNDKHLKPKFILTMRVILKQEKKTEFQLPTN